MYLDFYHLKKKPFQINTDPSFLWLGEKHKEALATLRYGIQDNKGFLLLTGDVGTGKTTMINALLNGLEEKIVVATIPDPALSLLEFYQYVAISFGIKQPIGNKVDFLLHFGQFLQGEADRERKVLLIIDEAQRVSHDLLEEIRLLSNIERQKTKLFNIFFIGQNELNDILAEPRNRALRQRITVNYHISTLSEDEVAGYIRHRLLIAGANRTLFSSDAVRQVYLFSNGYPRLINVICDRALLTGYVEEAREIKGKMVKECARELKLPQRSWLEAVKPNREGGDGSLQAEEQVAGATGPKVAGRRWRVYAGAPALLAAGAAIAFFHAPGAQIEPGSRGTPDAMVAEQAGTGAESASMTLPQPAVTASPPAETEQPPQRVKPVRAVAAVPAGSGISEEALPEGPLPIVSAVSVPADQGSPAGPAEYSINFPSNSNELSPSSYQKLDRLADLMLERPDLRALVTGYTDSSGFYRLNINISESRANMVKGYLVGRGIAPDRIRTAGRGPEDPVASNDTVQGRQLNRRVEIALTRGS